MSERVSDGGMERLGGRDHDEPKMRREGRLWESEGERDGGRDSEGGREGEG